MNEITATAGGAIMPAREISAALFADFVAFIDRGERTTKTYLTNLRQFMAWLKYREIPRPQRVDILSYREWLAAEHDAIEYAPELPAAWKYRTDKNGNPRRITCKPNTIKQYLQSVRQFFRWTSSNGYYPDIAANIHAPKIRTDAHKKDSLTAAEVLTIEQSITAHTADKEKAATEAKKDTAGRVHRAIEQGLRMRAIYVLAVNAGLRTVEISRAKVKDIETKGGRAFLYIWGKGHDEPDQKKPLANEVKKIIDEYMAARTDHPTGDSPLFVSTGNRSAGKRIASTTISRMIKKAMQDAGFNSDRLTAHSLRHTAGQNVLELTGKNIYETQLYMRHASPKTTEIYLENDSTEQDAAIADQLYCKYHNTTAAGDTAPKKADEEKLQLEKLIDSLPTEKRSKLFKIIEALA